MFKNHYYSGAFVLLVNIAANGIAAFVDSKEEEKGDKHQGNEFRSRWKGQAEKGSQNNFQCRI